jgi:CTP:molybdopterin cytidylyltransferase MocA
MIGPALIPAAGHSVRMGRPKLLLPLGGETILERLLHAARDGGLTRAIVVVRPDDEELAEVAVRAGADVVRLRAATPDMRATVLAGLDWIEARLPLTERPGFFLIPADHPVVSGNVFRTLAARIGQDRDSIIVPTFEGRRGHPVWIAWSHVAGIRTVAEGRGLNAYLRSQAAQTLEAPWPTAEVLIDLDTMEDYERLCRDAKGGCGPGNIWAGSETRPTLLTADGASLDNADHRPAALLPGSFHPVHEGHWGLAGVAGEILGAKVAFELSRRNVDKPELTDEEISRRAAPFRGRADLWITRSPRFIEKALHFPGVTFVVGADTAARLFDARYYEGNEDRLAAALDELELRFCRFLVAARVDNRGTLLTLDDLPIPPRWRALFEAVPASRFRLDISSTEMRRREGLP